LASSDDFDHCIRSNQRLSRDWAQVDTAELGAQMAARKKALQGG
jgi:hypothetical protein